MSLALARRYRPRRFEELVGQEHVVRALTNALTQSRLHHAYLFTGTRGVGKTTLARILAKAFNCETGVTAQPCGQCGACTEIDSGRFVDLLELDAASNTQVDQMRELLENALYAPTKGRFKVYIIDEVHMLSRSAFNAMLKTLEEPPEHVKFILATTDPQKVPVTVLSRCLQFSLKQIPQGEIRQQLAHVLEQEKVAFDPPALVALARAAQGSLRDALSLLDQAIVHGAGKVEDQSVREMLGAVDRGRLIAMLGALSEGDAVNVIAIADELQTMGSAFDAALDELASLLHRLALSQTIPEALSEDEPEIEALRLLSRQVSAEELQLWYQIAIHGRADLGLAPDHHAGFTMTLLRMLTFRNEAAVASSAAPSGPMSAPTPGVAASPAGTRSLPSSPRSRSSEPSEGADLRNMSQSVSAPAGMAPSLGSPSVRSPSVRSPSVRSPSVRSPSVLSPSVTEVAASRASDEAPAPAAAEATPPLSIPERIDDWPEFIATLKLGGMAAMLAQHCTLDAQTAEGMTLRLPEAHKHLLDKAYRDKLQIALEQRLNRKLAVQILVGDTQGRSPSEIEAARRRQLQDKAVASIEADPFVRELVENFDGRIISDSIKPLQ